MDEGPQKLLDFWLCLQSRTSAMGRHFSTLHREVGISERMQSCVRLLPSPCLRPSHALLPVGGCRDLLFTKHTFLPVRNTSDLLLIQGEIQRERD